MSCDETVVAAQLGRRPRGSWRVASRCPHGNPSVIATAPRLKEGEPFPTTFWLTCPDMVAAVGALESAGGVAEWASRLAHDPSLARRALEADEEYRRIRDAEGGVPGPKDVGTAGQRDPLRTKCLHAHVAAALAGISDPVGEAVLSGLADGCADAACGSRRS
ncbi:MAG: DUF501 domain-containing protein [Coriobacteriia bacterium]